MSNTAPAPNPLEKIKQAIVAAEKAAEIALAETRKAGAARIKIIKDMEQQKKDAMILIKQQRIDLLKYLQQINRHDAEYRAKKELIERLKIEYTQVANTEARKAIGEVI